MSLIQGLQDIADAQDEQVVVFDTPLTAPPEVILAVVENTSADSLKLAISAEITSKSTTGFTASLSQTTNSANYKLSWYVSDAGALAALVNTALGGRRISELPTAPTLEEGDTLTLIRPYPYPHAMQVQWGSTANGLLRRTDVPVSEVSPGTVGDWAATSSGFWFYGDSGWVLYEGQPAVPRLNWVESVPADSDAPGTERDVVYDGNYLNLCVGPNTWVRFQGLTF